MFLRLSAGRSMSSSTSWGNACMDIQCQAGYADLYAWPAAASYQCNGLDIERNLQDARRNKYSISGI